MTDDGMNDAIRGVLDEFARLGVDTASVADGDNLYRLGLTSHASVNVMLALEDAFDIEFPEQLLRKGTFESIDSIRAAVSEVLAPEPANASG